MVRVGTVSGSPAGAGERTLTGPEARRELNEQFARLAGALAHPGRVELLELLAQGERQVDALVQLTGMGARNTSAQLQVLRRARLVETRKDGRRVYYRLAGEEVARFVGSLRDLARRRLGEVGQVVHDYFQARDALDPIDRTVLEQRLRVGDVIVLDVRPSEEYAAGHIPGSVSMPLERLAEAVEGGGAASLADLDVSPATAGTSGCSSGHRATLGAISAGVEIVAYCRGPYCVLATEAVALLREAGLRARRLDGGLPEWRLEGRAVVTDGSAA